MNMVMPPEPGVSWRDPFTNEEKHGIILNSAYCPTRGDWFMLVMESGGRFHNICASGLEVYTTWAVDVVAMDEGYGEDDADDDA